MVLGPSRGRAAPGRLTVVRAGDGSVWMFGLGAVGLLLLLVIVAKLSRQKMPVPPPAR